MLSKFNEKTQKAIAIAESIAFDLGHMSVGTEHLLLAFLKVRESKLRTILNGYQLSYEDLKEQIISLFGKKDNKTYYMEYTSSLKQIIEYAILEGRKSGEDKVGLDTLAFSLLNNGENVATELLIKNKVPIEKIKNELKKNIKKKSELDLIDDLTNINNLVKNKKEELVGRERELQILIESLLRKEKPNALLIGDPGVGKTAIVYHLARLINKEDVPEELKNKTIYELDVSNVVAGTKYRGEFEEKLKKIMKKVKEDPNAIIFIDEIHNIIGAGGAEGAIDASSILKPHLSRGELQCIGATTFDEYVKIFEKEKALERRFQVIKIDETNYEETKKILEYLIHPYKKFHKIDIDLKLIDTIIYYCTHYIPQRYFPDKAIDVLDCSFVRAKQEGRGKVLEEDIINVIEKHCKVKIIKDKKAKHLSIDLKNNIIGQESAIKAITNQISCIEKGLTDDNKPLGVYLFVGPTGVGKTESAKIIANSFFGDSSKMIKIDMAEFMEPHSVSKLIGSPPGYVGYDTQTFLIDEVRKKPHSVILLDEIEKAHKEVLDIFLNVFDEGYFIDANKRKIDFKNTIIILTSNLGYKEEMFHKKGVGFAPESVSIYDVNNAISKHFRPEFINRIDEIIYFSPLNEETCITLAKKYYDEYIEKMNINIEIDEKQLQDIAVNSDINRYGARGIKREIKKYLSQKLKDEEVIIL